MFFCTSVLQYYQEILITFDLITELIWFFLSHACYTITRNYRILFEACFTTINQLSILDTTHM